MEGCCRSVGRFLRPRLPSAMASSPALSMILWTDGFSLTAAGSLSHGITSERVVQEISCGGDVMVFRFLLATVTCGMSANGGAIRSKPSVFSAVNSKIRPSNDKILPVGFVGPVR